MAASAHSREALRVPDQGHLPVLRQRFAAGQPCAATESYEVARKYIRLEAQNLTEPRLSRLSAQTNLDPEAFEARFKQLFENRAVGQ